MAGRENARVVHAPPRGQAEGLRGLPGWASGAVLQTLPALPGALPSGRPSPAEGHGSLRCACSQYKNELQRFQSESEHLAGSLDWQALLQDETTSPIQICSLLEAALEGFSIAGIALCRQLWRAAQPHDCVVKFAAKPTARALEFNILKKQEDFADAQEGSLRNTLNIHLFEDMQLTDETLQVCSCCNGVGSSCRLRDSISICFVARQCFVGPPRGRAHLKRDPCTTQVFAGRMPHSLASLSLSFAKRINVKFSDASLEELAGRLPQSLTSLSLDFGQNRLFTDASLKELAGRLPQSLTSLSLDFGQNRLFTDASLKELAGRLPQSLTSLSLDFGQNWLFTDASLKELAGRLPQSLTSLSLDFGQNRLFTDASLKELAGRLPQSLTSLSLDFGQN